MPIGCEQIPRCPTKVRIYVLMIGSLARGRDQTLFAKPAVHAVVNHVHVHTNWTQLHHVLAVVLRIQQGLLLNVACNTHAIWHCVFHVSCFRAC